MLDKYGVPQEPEEGHVIAYDWQDEPIFDTDGEHYFNTDHGYVMNDLYELREYITWLYGNACQVGDNLKEE